MARLPTADNVGPLPSANSGRQVASYDASALGRAAAATAEGGRDLGRGITSFGNSLAAVERSEQAKNDELETARFNSGFAVAKLETDYGLKAPPSQEDIAAPDDEEDDSAATVPTGGGSGAAVAPGGAQQRITSGNSRVDGQVDDLVAKRDELLNSVSDPRRRELLKLKTDDDLTKSRILADTRANKIWKDKNVAFLSQSDDKFISTAIESDDPAERVQAIDAQRALHRSYVAKGIFSEKDYYAWDTKFKNRYAEAFADAQVRKGNVDAVISDLEAASLNASKAPPPKPPGPRSDLGGLNEKRIAQINGKPEIASTIEQAAERHGVDPNFAKVVASIESGGNANAKTGSYEGLFQLSKKEMARYGGGNTFDPAANADRAMQSLKEDIDSFKRAMGRDPSPTEIYMSHQQGRGGVIEHVRNPDQPAWQSMYATAEGQEKGVGWAKRAIWGNVPDDLKGKFGTVENVTSGDLISIYGSKISGGKVASADAPVKVASTDAGFVPGSDQPPPAASPGDTKVAEAARPATVFDAMEPLAREKLLIHMKQTRDAQAASDARQLRLQDQQAKAASEKMESDLLQNIYGDNPDITAKDIVNNDILTREAKERMIGVVQRSNKPDPIAQVSRETLTGLLDRIRRDDGDPEKITNLNPLYDALIGEKLTRTDFEFAKKEFMEKRTPDGEALSTKKKAFLDGIKPSIDKSNPLMGVVDPTGAQQFYTFQFDLNRRIEEATKAGKNPHDLFDPSKPDFMGKPEVITPYQKTLQQSLQDQVRTLTAPNPNAGTKVQTFTPVEARKEGESIDDYLKRTGRK